MACPDHRRGLPVDEEPERLTVAGQDGSNSGTLIGVPLLANRENGWCRRTILGAWSVGAQCARDRQERDQWWPLPSWPESSEPLPSWPESSEPGPLLSSSEPEPLLSP